MITTERTFSALGKAVWIWTDSVGALGYLMYHIMRLLQYILHSSEISYQILQIYL